jgi:hypothetical protein
LTAAATATPKSRLTLGLALIGIGLLLTLETAGVVDVGGLGRWWPLLLIGVGLVKLRQPIEDGQRAAGVALLFLGGLFQLIAILSLGKAWPLILVGIGGFLLWQAASRPARIEPVRAESPLLSEMALIGYLKRSVHSSAFRRAYVTAVMGGVELDLRQAKMGPGPAHIDVVAFWGGIELKVPASWTVDARVVPLIGAFDNSTHADSGATETLIVRGHAIMGAVVINN